MVCAGDDVVVRYTIYTIRVAPVFVQAPPIKLIYVITFAVVAVGNDPANRAGVNPELYNPTS